VQVSSGSVYHPGRPQRAARESEAPDPGTVRWPNGYGRTKALAERLVLARRPAAIVLRPHAVYGPGDTTLLPRLSAAVRAGVLPLPGSGRQRHSLTRIDHLAQACLLACTAPVAATGRAYNITDAEPVVLAQALAEALAARGRRVRIVPIGLRPALVAAALAERVQRRPTLSRYAAGHLALERTFDLTAARDLLGYCPGQTQLGDAAGW
jgi:nucleoside-diphosphate-sugar epimerase